jgi:hypothetical protein
MENPSTWGPAERVIQKALAEAEQDRVAEVIGLSTARRIADALRAAGLLKES